MTGVQHFLEAESYLAAANEVDPGWSDEGERGRHLAAAQVHATLALAAVTAAAELSLTSLGADRPIEAWRDVIV